MTSLSDFHIFLSMDRSNRMDPRHFERLQQTSSPQTSGPGPDRGGSRPHPGIRVVRSKPKQPGIA
jgi:hypothetical protein